MDFGAFVPQGWRFDLVGVEKARHWEVMAGVAGTIEESGFTSAWVYDHFHTTPVPSQEVTYEAWTLMAALAVSTNSVRLGQMCTCNSYRPPAYLAKVAASIDVISEGRLEMGIGGGWYEHEYLGYGYPFPKASVRLGQLREAVEIMRRMWTEDEVVFHGEHYRLEGAICQPKPVQDPHVPLWIAGGGEKITLAIAARHADYTNFGNGSVEAFAHKSEVLAGHCREIGRDVDEITRSTNLNVICGESEAHVEDQLRRFESFAIGEIGEERGRAAADLFREMSGTPEQLVEKLRPWAAAGMAYAIVYFPMVAIDPSGLELFGREVIPAFG